MNRYLLCLLVAVTMLTGSSCQPTSVELVNARTPESGDAQADPGEMTEYKKEVVLTGLRGPTQMIVGPDGRLWVAQLNGGENDGTGQVVAVDLESRQQEVLVENLRKPTGLAVVGSNLWIVAGPDILRASLEVDGRPGAVETVLADLPTNGRSNGTLTVTPDGNLLYETSGRRSGDKAAEGSGALWQLDPENPTTPLAIATGLKGAYAHVFDSSGRLWTTEISDDLVDGQAPPDEINQVLLRADYGWPSCMGTGEPARVFGGTEESCAATTQPLALLPPHATPTSLVESPWEPGVLLVTLFVSGELVRIDTALAADGAPAAVTAVLEGLQQPQHLLTIDEGALLLSEHGSGVVYKITRVPN